MLYTNDLTLLASLICREGSGILLTHVSLHYFNIVEMHCLDRVI
jgi:hypothetical protein